MKRVIITFIVALVTCVAAVAQTAEEVAVDNQTIYISDSGEQSLAADDDGSMLLTVNGIRFKFGGNENTKSDDNGGGSLEDAFGYHAKRVHIGIFGLGSPSYNHLALVELGKSWFVGESYSGYSSEEIGNMEFTSNRSTHATCNLIALNVTLDKRNKFVFSTGFGFSVDRAHFAKNVTLNYDNGRISAVELDPTISKSWLTASYLHFPLLFDWNISNGFFLSVGAYLDVLMSSALEYKKPKTKVEGTMPLNPVQVGVSGRIGWRRLYAFVNYTPMSFYKSQTNVKLNRMSAGVGIWF